MRRVTYSMGVSADGYIVGPGGDFAWTAPDEEEFRFVTDEIRDVGVHLLGRRLYETMLYWETAEQDPSLDFSTLEWAALWTALPKVVFATTRARVYPVLVGGGIPFYPQHARRWISNSSKPAPSARRSSTSATGWRASRRASRGCCASSGSATGCRR